MSDGAIFTGKSEGEAIFIVILFVLLLWLIIWGSFKRGVDAIQMANSIERTRANLGLPPTNTPIL